MGAGCSSTTTNGRSSKVTSKVAPTNDRGSSSTYGDQPSHWDAVAASEYRGNGFRMVRLQKDTAIMALLERFLEVDDPKNLGVGRDVQEKSRGKYVKLTLSAAWRIQNPSLWSRYVAGKSKIRRDVHSLAKVGKGLPKRGGPGLPLRLHAFAKALPGGPLDEEVNETMLMHGTKPQFLLDILANGPNERYSGATGALFGHGMYFAEDADKVDQYVSVDKEFIKQRGPSKGALHARLYPGSAREGSHPGSVYYMLLCRVALGHYVRTRDQAPTCKSIDGGGGGPVFARENPRELSNVPNVNPPIHYHALIGEKGPGHLRHREVVCFHGEYLYPEYLLGVQRLSAKGVPL